MNKPISLFHVPFLLPNFVSGEVVDIYSLNHVDDLRVYCTYMLGHKFNAKNELHAHTSNSYQEELTFV